MSSWKVLKKSLKIRFEKSGNPVSTLKLCGITAFLASFWRQTNIKSLARLEVPYYRSWGPETAAQPVLTSCRVLQQQSHEMLEAAAKGRKLQDREWAVLQWIVRARDLFHSSAGNHSQEEKRGGCAGSNLQFNLWSRRGQIKVQILHEVFAFMRAGN